MSITESIQRLESLKNKIKAVLINKEVSVQGVPFEQYPELIGRIKGDLSEFEIFVDEINGSYETYNDKIDLLAELSTMCDVIIGKKNSSILYDNNDLDRFDELNNIADEIIGG